MFATVNVGTASAQNMVADSRTDFTFNAPVELPGVTLPPGSYTFRFADPMTSKTVMQVLAKDGSNKTYGIFMVREVTRPTPSSEAELRFIETPAGTPAAVKTWWYPGNSIGREFIYPRSQALRLAKANQTPVLTTTAENVAADQMQGADLSYISPNGDLSAANGAGADMANNNGNNNNGNSSNNNASASSSASNSTTNMVRTPVQESTSAANTTSRRSLPRTNGMLPLMGLLGFSSLAGGVSLRFRRR